jgi:hypothetical protein
MRNNNHELGHTFGCSSRYQMEITYISIYRFSSLAAHVAVVAPYLV